MARKLTTPGGLPRSLTCAVEALVRCDERRAVPHVERAAVVGLAHGVEHEVAPHRVVPREPVVKVDRVTRAWEEPPSDP